jgi:hypothetical protein
LNRGYCKISEEEGERADVLHKSQETAINLKKLPASVFPNASQRVSKPQWKKLAKSRLQFVSATFYVPERPCNNDYFTPFQTDATRRPEFPRVHVCCQPALIWQSNSLTAPTRGDGVKEHCVPHTQKCYDVPEDLQI